jgi:hypothetical protein
MSAQDPALLNTILAVPYPEIQLIKISSSHMGTWRKSPDRRTQGFLSTALNSLQKNLSNPETAASQATIATTFLLSMHEIFNASTARWRQHLRGAADLIRFRGGSSDLHPVIKRNLFMLDLQSALNVGGGFYFQSEEWMEEELEKAKKELDARPDWPISAVEPGRREACIIDPLLGTSIPVLLALVLPSV